MAQFRYMTDPSILEYPSQKRRYYRLARFAIIVKTTDGSPTPNRLLPIFEQPVSPLSLALENGFTNDTAPRAGITQHTMYQSGSRKPPCHQSILPELYPVFGKLTQHPHDKGHPALSHRPGATKRQFLPTRRRRRHTCSL